MTSKIFLLTQWRNLMYICFEVLLKKDKYSWTKQSFREKYTTNRKHSSYSKFKIWIFKAFYRTQSARSEIYSIIKIPTVRQQRNVYLSLSNKCFSGLFVFIWRLMWHNCRMLRLLGLAMAEHNYISVML